MGYVCFPAGRDAVGWVGGGGMHGGDERTVNKEQSTFTAFPVTIGFHRRPKNGLEINP